MKLSALFLGLLPLAPPTPQNGETAVLRLEPGQPLEEHLHREYGTDQGLPSGWIHELLQTRDGYLWVGTHNGLARFDGATFRVFNTRNADGLASDDIRTLCESRDGTVWIGGSGGLTRYTAGRPGVFETVSELSGLEVRKVYEDPDGEVWAATSGGLWHSVAGQTFASVPGSPVDLRAVCMDGEGTLWVGAPHGLFRREREVFVRWAEDLLPDDPRPNYLLHAAEVRKLHCDDQGFWVGARIGLLRAGTEGFSLEEKGSVDEILRSRTGWLYLGVHNTLRRSNGTGFEVFDTPNAVCAMVEDHEGGLWVGYGGNLGLHRFQNLDTGVVLSDHFVRCVREDPSGTVWFGTDDGVFGWKNGAYTHYPYGDGLPSQSVTAIAPGRDGGLWLGTTLGLARLSGGQIEHVQEPAEIANLFVFACLEDTTGTLWLARWGHGAFVVRDGRAEPLAELPNGQTEWFHEDEESQVWVGHSTGVFRGRPGNLRRVRDPQLDRLPARSQGHYAAPNGDLWIATTGGIARRRPGGSSEHGRIDVFTVRDGLAAGFIERLSADNNGNLWLAGRHGVFYVSLHELDEFAAGRLSSFESHRVIHDRDLSSLAQGHGFPNAWLASDGTMYLPARFGAITVPPEPIEGNPVAPPIDIERVLLDGEAIDANDGVTFERGQHRLTIDFCVVSFGNPEGARARYRLEGYDPDWIEAGRERSATYTSLPPGAYSFQLTAENESGVTTALEARLDVTVRRRWFELMWVRSLALAVVVCLTVLFFQLRHRAVERRNTALRSEIAERKRAEEEARQSWDQLSRVSRAASMGEITTSIAHEVKQPLFAITSNAQAAKRLLQGEQRDLAEVFEALDDISSDGTRAAEIIDRVRALVRKEHRPLEDVDLNEVARDAVRLVTPEIQRRGLALRTDYAPDLPGVRGDPVELQQVLINLIINGAQAMEDSAGGHLSVETFAINGSVTAAVRDEGAGIDEGLLDRLFEPFFTTKPGGTGMGLAMNRAIIERHGGRIWATPNPERGTTFEFRLDARSQD